MTNKPTFTICGTGFIFPRHIAAIKEIGGEIVDIVNDFGGRVAAWYEFARLSPAKYFVILTPNDWHFEMAYMARQFGKIVLCEKPLVIKSEHAKILGQYDNIFVVQQLRYHPLVAEIQKAIKGKEHNEIEMDIAVHRDPDYFQSWKGNKERSGGVLFNLGIHFFDLLLYLFGPVKQTFTEYIDDITGMGSISGANYQCNWRVSAGEARERQRRVFKINGQEYNFSSLDNLSYENLHHFVYRDLIQGKGITPKDVLRSIELVECLYNNQ